MSLHPSELPHDILPTLRRGCVVPAHSLALDSRVTAAYPDLNDDDFVRDNLERWLG